MTTDNISLESSIQEKVAWAEAVYQTYGKDLLKDPRLSSLLHRYKKAARDSHREMVRVGITEVCRRCDTDEGGSCCGAGLEKKYDPVLLLLNRLLHVPLPEKRHDPQGCFFLGERGCTLLARQVICVNYLCRKITDRFSPDMIARLKEKEGTELDLLFLVHDLVKKRLRAME
jgi:hypothetical protein